MLNVATDAPATPVVYAIPEQERFMLVQLNTFVRLMAQLTQPGTPASMANRRLAPDAIGWCFERLSKELDAIVAAIRFDRELAASTPHRADDSP